MDGFSRGPTARLICHCLLAETEHGLVLVDTGFGRRDVEAPYRRLSPLFIHLNRIQFEHRHTALHQVRSLGFSPRDVRHIVLTHLDFDHAGGLDDFPAAQVHLLEREKASAFGQTTWLDRQRYRPQQWGSHGRWQLHGRSGGESWFGFEQVCTGQGMPRDVALVPLPGHTFGHAGVAIHAEGRWLLQAGDAYFHHREMDAEHPWCTPGLRAYQTLMEKCRQSRLANQQRLRELSASHPEVQLCCSHDPVEFERLSGRPESLPVAAAPP
jgi:glyoxylase-like metal-dependent hydrolase (beta-lactamase superfamily II)